MNFMVKQGLQDILLSHVEFGDGGAQLLAFSIEAQLGQFMMGTLAANIDCLIAFFSMVEATLTSCVMVRSYPSLNSLMVMDSASHFFLKVRSWMTEKKKLRMIEPYWTQGTWKAFAHWSRGVGRLVRWCNLSDVQKPYVANIVMTGWCYSCLVFVWQLLRVSRWPSLFGWWLVDFLVIGPQVCSTARVVVSKPMALWQWNGIDELPSKTMVPRMQPSNVS